MQCSVWCTLVTLQPRSSSQPPPPLPLTATSSQSTTFHSNNHNLSSVSTTTNISLPLYCLSHLLNTQVKQVRFGVAASDVNRAVLCQSSLDIQLDLKCHLAFSNYPQLEIFHKLWTSTTSMINFEKFSPNQQFVPNTEMPHRFV